MAAFLEYLHSLAEHISLSHDNTFRLPHKIEGDRIDKISIKLQQSSEERWTNALKYLLTNLKAILYWVIQHERNEMNLKS
jgi:beclin 1